MSSELLRERTDPELGFAFYELQRSSREHVRSVSLTRSSMPPEPMRTLPKLGDELGRLRAIDGACRSIPHGFELVGREPDVQGDDGFAASTEHFSRKRRLEPDRVKIEVGRRVEQRMLLPGGKREKLSRRNANDAISHREASRTPDHEVQLGLSVEMPRALSSD
jgi:hypothetical protein